MLTLKEVPFSSLEGKTIYRINRGIGDVGHTELGEEWLDFYTTGGERFVLYHEQDCCENVRIEDITGDLRDLLQCSIGMAEETSSSGEADEYGTCTWTFYKLATIEGYVTIRWKGESNGYYSERVSFAQVTGEKE